MGSCKASGWVLPDGRLGISASGSIQLTVACFCGAQKRDKFEAFTRYEFTVSEMIDWLALSIVTGPAYCMTLTSAPQST